MADEIEVMADEIEARACMQRFLTHHGVTTWQGLFDSCVTHIRDNVEHCTPYVIVCEPPTAIGCTGSIVYLDTVGAINDMAGHDGINLKVADDGLTLQMRRAQLCELVEMHYECLRAGSPACHMVRPVIVQFSNPLKTFLLYHTLSDTEPLRTKAASRPVAR